MTSIFDYQNYREFLKDYYQAQKRKTGFTYARFSTSAGLKSPNYFKLVMDGQKNLTTENIARFSKTLALSDVQSEYFNALVNFNQAKRPLEKDYYEGCLRRVKSRYKGTLNKRVLEETEFEAMSNWLHHTVMVMTAIQGFRESPAWIKQQLFNLVTEDQIAQILETLLELKLVTRTKDGRLKQTHRQIVTKPELRQLTSRVFYEGMLSRAAQAVRISSQEEREFGTYIVGLSPSQLPALKKKVRAFLQSLNEWALENTTPSKVYALLFAGFPLTDKDPRYQQ